MTSAYHEYIAAEDLKRPDQPDHDGVSVTSYYGSPDVGAHVTISFEGGEAIVLSIDEARRLYDAIGVAITAAGYISL